MSVRAFVLLFGCVILFGACDNFYGLRTCAYAIEPSTDAMISSVESSGCLIRNVVAEDCGTSFLAIEPGTYAQAWVFVPVTSGWLSITTVDTFRLNEDDFVALRRWHGRLLTILEGAWKQLPAFACLGETVVEATFWNLFRSESFD